MPFNLAHVVLHSAYVQQFTVRRSTGDWVNGRWVEGTVTDIIMSGVVAVANEKELNALEGTGDRIKGAMVFHSTQEILLTGTGTNQGISDKILWNGQWWRVFNVGDWSDYGFYKAFAERIKGS